MSVKQRFGNFFLTLGIILLALFFISDYGQDVNGWFLLFGLISFGLGIYLIRAGRAKPNRSDRFRTARRLFGGKKDDGQSDEAGDDN